MVFYSFFYVIIVQGSDKLLQKYKKYNILNHYKE